MPVPKKPTIPHPTSGVVAEIRAEARQAAADFDEPDELVDEHSGAEPESNDSGVSVAGSSPSPKAPLIVDLAEPPEASEGVHTSFALSMITISLAGIGLLASQFPYGRFGTVGLAIVGLFFGLFALATADRKWHWPATGLGLNAFALILATLLPNWLGMSAWRPPVNIVDDATLVKIMPYDGGPAMVAEDGWVDATKGSWQQGDLRVTLTAAWVSKVELVALKDKAPANARANLSKDKKLQITLRLSNVGASRRLEYGSWDQATPADAAPVRLVQFNSTAEPAQRVLLPARFEAGWNVAGRGIKSTLFPGAMSDDLLVFDALPPMWNT